MLDGLRLAVGTLTVLPTGRVEVTRRTAAVGMVLAPVAVLPLAVPVAVSGWLLGRVGAPAAVSAVLLLVLLALSTRALHLDGLADTADGLGAGWDRDRALAVMRRGDTGPMGVVAAVLVLALQATSIASVLSGSYGWLVVAGAVCVSRSVLALACARPVRPARTDGLGAAVVGSVPLGAVVGVWLVTGAGCAALAYVAGRPVWVGVVAGGLAAIAAVVIVAWCTRRLGGVTGDVLGAAVEIGFAAVLLVFAL